MKRKLSLSVLLILSAFLLSCSSVQVQRQLSSDGNGIEVEQQSDKRGVDKRHMQIIERQMDRIEMNSYSR